MRLSRSAGRVVASVLLFGAIHVAGPLTPIADPGSDIQICMEVCRIIVQTCEIECMQGGSPPEFNPAGCMVECNHLMAGCMEACRPPS
jgi:hypothetical protein